MGKSRLLVAAAIIFAIALVIIKSRATPESKTASIVANPGFEEPLAGFPARWIIDEKLKDRGTISLDGEYKVSGKWSLKVSPNERNTDKSQLLGAAQLIPAEPLVGRRYRIGGHIKTIEGTGGTIIAATIDQNGQLSGMASLTQEWERSQFVYQDKYIWVGDQTKFVIVGCYADGTSGAAWFDDISLIQNDPIETIKPIKGLKASIKVDASTHIREIKNSLFGTNLEWAWNANGLWDPVESKIRPEILNPTKQLGISTIRFPGGFFSDYYHWRDGIGPRDKRPSQPHSPGADISPNTFGTDELAELCRTVGAEPLITVNIITGTAQEAAEWVLYCNQPGNKERIANGHIRPYGIRLWEIGNEQYLKGSEGVGITSHLPCDEYIRRLKEWSVAMRKADPSIKIIAVGASNHGRNTMTSDENWNRKLLEQAAEYFDYLAVHNAYAPVDASGSNASFYEVYQALFAFPILVKQHIASIDSEIKKYAKNNPHHIGIAVTEWGPLFHILPSDKWIDHCKTLGSGIYVASLMKSFLESPNMEIANFFKLCEYSFMGWIGGNGTPKPSYYALQMYTKHFGRFIASTSVKSPSYNSKGVSHIDAVRGVPYIEAISSLSADRSKLYVIVINKSIKSPITTEIEINGFRPAKSAKIWTLTAPSLDANNGKDLIDYPGLSWGKQIHAPENTMFEDGKPGTVMTQLSIFKNAGMRFQYQFQPISVTCIEMDSSRN